MKIFSLLVSMMNTLRSGDIVMWFRWNLTNFFFSRIDTPVSVDISNIIYDQSAGTSSSALKITPPPFSRLNIRSCDSCPRIGNEIICSKDRADLYLDSYLSRCDATPRRCHRRCLVTMIVIGTSYRDNVALNRTCERETGVRFPGRFNCVSLKASITSNGDTLYNTGTRG